MNLTRVVGAASLAAGIGLAGALSGMTATASADSVCDHPPNPAFCQRGIDDGRRDHQPFDYNGQQVNPVFDHDRNAWGFYFLGAWIPL